LPTFEREGELKISEANAGGTFITIATSDTLPHSSVFVVIKSCYFIEKKTQLLASFLSINIQLIWLF